MFSHLTDWELTIYGFVIAIFTIAPLPLFPDRHPQPKPLFHLSQSIQEMPTTGLRITSSGFNR